MPTNLSDWMPTVRVCVAVAVLGIAGYVLWWGQDQFGKPVTVAWERQADVPIAAGPVGFQRERTSERTEKLSYLGPMDDLVKLQLVELYPKLEQGNQPKAFRADRQAYFDAVDELVMKVIELTQQTIHHLLLLGGFSGILGVQLRSMWETIHPPRERSSSETARPIAVYAMRVVIGFVLGVLAISLVMSGLLDVGDHSQKGILWWLSITVLAGFGADEFMLRLQLVVRGLFGTEGNRG